MLSLRAAAQRLTSDTARGHSPAAILRQVVGLQAQVLSAATLGMRVRSRGLRKRDVERALDDERSIARTWLMRGTLHVAAAEDLRWLVALLGPVFARAGATRYAQLGLDDDLKTRGVAAVRRILTDSGPLTRRQLLDGLRARGIVLDPKTQALIHLIGLAALEGVLCLGPELDDGESTYALLDDWVPRVRTPSREQALGELARRYFAAYGPATVADLSAWSGIGISEARSAVVGARSSLAEVTIDGEPGFVRKDRVDQVLALSTHEVRLLPAFDTYLLAYRRRDLAVPPALQRRLQRGGGWLHPAVIVNGRSVAAWSLRKSGGRGQVQVELFSRPDAAVRTGIEAEVLDIGRFLDLQMQVEFTQSDTGRQESMS
ncbi:MAG TPA: winged helix DNA-binding domain-containing protein [Candidatus Dormibacteraeota bacterium]